MYLIIVNSTFMTIEGSKVHKNVTLPGGWRGGGNTVGL